MVPSGSYREVVAVYSPSGKEAVALRRYFLYHAPASLYGTGLAIIYFVKIVEEIDDS